MSNRVDPIDAEELQRALAATGLSGRVVHLPTVDSTNRLALTAAAEGASVGVWVADEQTAGRGRAGHSWHSTAGEGLYVSVLAKPDLQAEDALKISLAAGLAAQEAIEQVAGISVDLRWPNDLVTFGGSPSRKLGGVLVESAIAPEDANGERRLRYAAIGVGLNVHHASFPAELGGLASSLRMEGWRAPQRQSLLLALLTRLGSNLRGLEQGRSGEELGVNIVAQLTRASTWVCGKRVLVGEDGGYTGITAGLDPSGFLLVKADDGSLRTVRSGGVREA